MNMLTSRRAIAAFAGPRRVSILNAPPPTPSSVAEMAQQINAGLADFRAAHDRDIAELRSGADELARNIGRLMVGGSGPLPDDRSPSAATLVHFNAALRERRRGGVEAVDPGTFAAYRQAFVAYLRHGRSAEVNPDIMASLSIGSDPAGGYLVVPQRDMFPRERLFRTSPMRAVASSVNLTMGGTFEGFTERDDVGAGWVAEREARTETDNGTWGSFRIDAHEVYGLISMTAHLVDDMAVNAEQLVMGRIWNKLTRTENTAFVTGNGVKKPRGFLDYKDTAVTTADATRPWGKLQYVPTGAAGAFPTVSGLTVAADVGCLYDIKAALHPSLRPDAVWAMNSSTFAYMEKLKDEDGRSLVRQSLDAATPDRLLGYPVVIFEDMPDIASDAFAVAFGNFQQGYLIVDKVGFRVVVDVVTNKGSIIYYAAARVGGDVVNFDAIKLLKFAAS